MRRFILASSSPRRKEILLKAGYDFEIIKSEKEESITSGISPEKFAVKNALIKAEDVYGKVGDKEAVVLGADTVVELDGVIYGKPKDISDAKRMLQTFSGKTHRVITGYALISGYMRESGKVITEVTFNDLNGELIGEYLKSGLWQGKAGAYGIQDGYELVRGYKGDYDNVVGLPIGSIDETIKEFLK